jgi:DNA-binding ferritin-like protein (Dps family)
MMSKQLLALKDASMDEILEFLEKAEAAGRGIRTVIGPQVQLDPSEDYDNDNSTKNVAHEARQIRMLFLALKG